MNFPGWALLAICESCRTAEVIDVSDVLLGQRTRVSNIRLEKIRRLHEHRVRAEGGFVSTERNGDYLNDLVEREKLKVGKLELRES